VQLPLYLTEVIMASNRPAAAIESTRNEIADGLSRIATAVGNRPQLAQQDEAAPSLINNSD
jgi:hypothetical protein